MDIFTWSMPFLVEKVAMMFYQLITKLGDEVEEVSVDEGHSIGGVGDARGLMNKQLVDIKVKQRKGAFKAKLAGFI